MIEYPEARTLARQLDAALRGARIDSAEAAHTPHRFAWFTGDPASYSERLAGRCVTGASCAGGWVLLHMGDLALALNDGATPRLYAADAALPPRHQLCIRISDGRALVGTVQMYGGFMLFGAEPDSDYYASALAAPDPLGDAFDPAHFAALRAAAPDKLSLKAFLATGQRIPGLGNGVLQDILFGARMNPRRALRTLDDADMGRLYRSVRDVLGAMTAAGGRDVWTDLHGDPGGYRTLLSRNSIDRPCPVCGAAIRRETYLGGNVYYCPVCQPR